MLCGRQGAAGKVLWAAGRAAWEARLPEGPEERRLQVSARQAASGAPRYEAPQTGCAFDATS